MSLYHTRRHNLRSKRAQRLINEIIKFKDECVEHNDLQPLYHVNRELQGLLDDIGNEDNQEFLPGWDFNWDNDNYDDDRDFLDIMYA